MQATGQSDYFTGVTEVISRTTFTVKKKWILPWGLLR